MKRSILLLTTFLSGSVLANIDPHNPNWLIHERQDKITNEYSISAVTNPVYPESKMGFPYEDVSSWLGVDCNHGKKQFFFFFSEMPNLVNTEIENGYYSISMRTKIDDEYKNIKFNQNFGGNFIFPAGINTNNDLINNLINRKVLLLELPWYGQGLVYFSYPIEGAKQALDEIAASCNSNETN